MNNNRVTLPAPKTVLVVLAALLTWTADARALITFWKSSNGGTVTDTTKWTNGLPNSSDTAYFDIVCCGRPRKNIW
jgi:hypothetical protein